MGVEILPETSGNSRHSQKKVWSWWVCTIGAVSKIRFSIVRVWSLSSRYGQWRLLLVREPTCLKAVTKQSTCSLSTTSNKRGVVPSAWSGHCFTKRLPLLPPKGYFLGLFASCLRLLKNYIILFRLSYFILFFLFQPPEIHILSCP